MKLRTLTLLPCLIGVVRGSWSEGCLLAYPFHHSWAVPSGNTSLMRICPKEKHVIHLSRNWAEALKQGLVGSAAEIAAQCGLTPGRVRQIVRLSGMDRRIVGYLAQLRGRSALQGFSESRLRPIVSLPQHEQCARFEKLFQVKVSM